MTADPQDPIEAWRVISERAARAAQIHVSAAVRPARANGPTTAAGIGAVLLAVVVVGVALTFRPSGAPPASDAVASSMSSAPASSPATATPVTSSAEDGTFRLELRTPKDRYTDLDAIEPVATITYLGPDAVGIVTHAARMVGFRIEQLDGKRTMGGGMDSVCVTSVLDKDRAVIEPFEKAGQPTGDANVGFDSAWYADEALQLPPGQWRITATLDVSTGGCGGDEHTVAVTNDITVIPAVRSTEPVTDASQDAMFRLDLTTPHGVYPAGVPIEPVATITFLGPDPSTTMFHGGSPVLFSIDEVGGSRRMDPVNTMPCRQTAIALGQQLSFPFGKAGEIGASFDADWFRDRALRLPPGTWRIRAQTSLNTGPNDACGSVGHGLVADNVIIVAGDAPPQIEPLPPTPEIAPSPTLAPPQPDPDPSVAPSVVQDGAFRLEIVSGKTDYLPTEPIKVGSTLTFVGPGDEVVFGHGDPAVAFSIEQLDGPQAMQGLVADVCRASTMARGQPSSVPFVRSGLVQGIFTEDWYRDPELRLPLGTWLVTASLDAYVPDCGLGGDVHHLTAGVVITVR